jgi:hypothetical protein
VDPTAGLDDVEKRKFLTLAGLELGLLCRPARSQSLHRLRYMEEMSYKTRRKETTWKTWDRWEVSIPIDVREMCCGHVD